MVNQLTFRRFQTTAVMSTLIQVDLAATTIKIPPVAVANRRQEGKEEVVADFQEIKAESYSQATKAEEGSAITKTEAADMNLVRFKAGLETRIEVAALATTGIRVATRIKADLEQIRGGEIRVKTEEDPTTIHMRIAEVSTQIAAPEGGVIAIPPILAENRGDKIFSMHDLDL
jgi:hypothetical protein